MSNRLICKKKNKQEIIQVSLKNLVCISTLIHSSISEWKVMSPLEKEILFIVKNN